MKFTVSFEYDEVARKWEVVVRGAATLLEAVQGFNAVLLTAAQATPGMHNLARAQPDGTYKISVGV